MFRSQSMYKVEIVVPEHDIVSVTEGLAAARAFHVADVSSSVGDMGMSQAGFWQDRKRRCLALEQRLLDLMLALDVSEEACHDEALHWIELDLAERDIDSLEREAREPVRKLNEARDKLAQFEMARDGLAPFVGIDVPLQAFRDARYVFSMFGLMPMESVARLRTSLEQTPSALVVFGERGHLAAVGLFGQIRDVEVLRRAARSAYLNPIQVPSEYRGTPQEVADSLTASIQRTRERLETYQSEVHLLQETRIRRMRHLLWRLRVSKHLIDTISGFRKFQYTYLIGGWVPYPEIEAVKQCVNEACDHAVIKVSELQEAERRHAPFFFKNPPLVRSFEQLVTTYSYPAYNELDPTPLLAITFPLIFGVMFGDVGHGLLLFFLGVLILSRKLKALSGLVQMGAVVAACGLASTFFGVLYGSLFGYEELIPALWLRPLERTEEILIATVVFGVVALSVGMIFNIVGSIQRRAWGRALFSNTGLAGLLFYWSLLGLGAGLLTSTPPVSVSVVLPLTVISSLCIALAGLLEPWVEGHAVDRSGVGMALMEGFFELFESVISLLSNTLSYVRMGAFAVAHGALSLVVFILAELVSPGHGLGYWVVVVLGNLFVIGFEGMIVAIQTLRLEYYELFSKFFIGGGLRFSPLSMLSAEQVF